MKINEYQWKSNGKNIYGASWIPMDDPVAVIIFLHGLGEHIRRYDQWFEGFCAQGYGIVTADHHGHGHSEGKRGHFESYCEPMAFTDLLFEKADQIFGKRPKILYGHSMGGNIALNYILRKAPRIKGGILSAPWIQLMNPPSKLANSAAGVLRHIYPSYALRSGIKRSQLTMNENELEKYDKDNLIHGRITINTYFELHRASQFATDHMHNLNIPLLILHGKADPIADFNGSLMLERKSPKMVTLRLFDNFLHEIHKEVDNHRAFSTIQEWLSSIV